MQSQVCFFKLQNFIKIFCYIACKGVSANLLQVGSKRRRTKQQIKDEKEAEKLKEQKIAAKLANYDVLQTKVKMMENDKENGDAAANLMK